MLIPPFRCKVEGKPNFNLGTVLVLCVDRFKYLGHIINDELSEDEDIGRKRRNVAIRHNVLIRRFTADVYIRDEVSPFSRLQFSEL